jgi:hypothetical protein
VKLDDEQSRENLIQLLALMIVLIIFLVFATSLTLARIYQLQKILETELVNNHE